MDIPHTNDTHNRMFNIKIKMVYYLYISHLEVWVLDLQGSAGYSADTDMS
jgi:hypothetical protein